MFKIIKDDLNKWKDICVQELEDILLRWQYSSNWSSDSAQFFIKILADFLGRNWQTDLKINIKKPKQSWKRKIKLKESHFLI